MQTIESISISNGQPVMAAPLGAVVLISMLKDAYEDYKRHVSDGAENNKKANVLVAGQFQKVFWKDIQPGQVVRVDEEESFPADMVLLKSSNEKGSVYIETKSLDGETNLKIKLVEKAVNGVLADDAASLAAIDGHIECEHPNNAIYKFEGTMALPLLQQPVPLAADNMVLRGCKLRNTDFVYGVTVFTGPETKIMKNSAKAKYKFSMLERYSNKAIAMVLVAMLVMSTIAGVLGTAFTFKYAENKETNSAG